MSDAGEATPDGWPVRLRGVTETVVATRGPDDRWNHAALGVHAGDPVTARTYGNTRTRRNFERRGSGVVQFVDDPRDFVDAALSIHETDERILDSAAAWVEVHADRIDEWQDHGTAVRELALTPVASEVRRRTVPTIDRGVGAVVDATVAASRLDVPGYDDDVLLDRLVYFAETVDTCGGPAERAAFARIDEYTGWRNRR